MNNTLKKLADIWPVIAFILALTFGMARADTILTDNTHRIEKLETAPERLARIETKIDNIQLRLDKENK